MNRRGASMDAGQDVWDWEVLPDHMSSSMCHDSTNLADDEETKEPTITPPSSDADVRDKPTEDFIRDGIGVVLDETKPSKEAAMPKVTHSSASDGEDEEKTFQSPDTKKPDEVTDPSTSDNGEEEEKTFQRLGTKEADDEKFHEEEEEEEDDDIKKNNCRARLARVVFSVGKLKVNGIGALCSFGVVAATVCIFLIGGKLQHHHHRQQQFYGDDKGIQQVVQQTSRVNQTMSSVMGLGGGTSTRANVLFDDFYYGF